MTKTTIASVKTPQRRELVPQKTILCVHEAAATNMLTIVERIEKLRKRISNVRGFERDL